MFSINSAFSAGSIQNALFMHFGAVILVLLVKDMPKILEFDISLNSNHVIKDASASQSYRG